jgi:hypothetical protein
MSISKTPSHSVRHHLARRAFVEGACAAIAKTRGWRASDAYLAAQSLLIDSVDASDPLSLDQATIDRLTAWMLTVRRARKFLSRFGRAYADLDRARLVESGHLAKHLSFSIPLESYKFQIGLNEQMLFQTLGFRR